MGYGTDALKIFFSFFFFFFLNIFVASEYQKST